MARIKTYNLDTEVSQNDTWIGTDGDSYNSTKNFSPLKLAEYFNSSETISSANSITFTYQTLDPGEERALGTISFESEIGATVDFSSISEIMFSKYSKGIKLIDIYLQDLVNSIVILHKSLDVNKYGIYKVVSVSEDLIESNFLNVQLSFIQGNSYIEEDKDYVLSLIDLYTSDSNDKNFVFTQDIPLDTWTVNHNLNKFPSASVVLPTGQKGYGDITYIDENNLTITFASAESGKAYIN